MKASSFISILVCAAYLLVTSVLTSCEDPYVEISAVPIKLQVILPSTEDEVLPDDAFSPDNPVRVVGYRQECQCYSKVFVEDAYIDEAGELVFINKPHYWLNDRLMKFTVYWPANSNVVMDNYGKVTSGDCVLVGHSIPMNMAMPNKDGSVSSYKFVIRPFDNSVE